jgi:hypothetical protein
MHGVCVGHVGNGCVVSVGRRELHGLSCKRMVGGADDAGVYCVRGAVQMTGATPLYIACQNGHAAVAELLLDRGAAVSQARV